MANKNAQGTGKAAPTVMAKKHVGLGNHKRVFRTSGAAVGQAPGSPATTHTGQK